MTLIVMPAQAAEQPSGGNNDTPFPAGPWQGRIDIVRSRDVPTNREGQPFSGYASKDGEVLSIQLGSNQPLDGQNSVGERKFFVDIPVRVGSDDLTTIDVTEFNSPNWQLQIGAKRIVNLAIALGVAELIGENGNSQWTVPTSFVDELRSGTYTNMEVGFSVRHRKTKSENRPIVEDLESFHSAD